MLKEGFRTAENELELQDNDAEEMQESIQRLLNQAGHESIEANEYTLIDSSVDVGKICL